MILISGPSALPPPANVELIAVRSATEMQAAVNAHLASADVLVMAAAVADYTPERRTAGKIEKADGPLGLTLVRTPDILADAGRARGASARPVLIGFAAESGAPSERGRLKLRTKQADMIVANDISRTDAGFDSETNAVTILTAAGDEEIPLAPKSQIASMILDRAEKLLAQVPVRSA